ncbi:hypothetical protein AWH60_08630 [Pseudoalteromonas haloplanktis]|nr:hypothetical protein AWH60_08630 [Pseudoalteromonas haloplanktis]
MSAFSIEMVCFSAPNISSVDALLFDDNSAVFNELQWQSWDACVYDCIIKSKELMAEVTDSTLPMIWLLPALSFKDELKQLLTQSLQQLYPDHSNELIFHGATAAHSAIALAGEKKWQKFNVIALDATFKTNKQQQFVYQGVGGALAVVEMVPCGWSQVSHEIAASIDFSKHNQLAGMLTRLAEQTENKIDLIFAPGNGVDDDSWLNNLQLLTSLIDEHTYYELPNYKLGKIGALEGLVNLYQLTTSPAIVEHFSHALMLSQEQAKHQGAASYLWISEEVHS